MINFKNISFEIEEDKLYLTNIGNMHNLKSGITEVHISGGMRLDYKTLSAFSLVSTSYQSEYLQYPFISGNILSAVIPEQAAVWLLGDERKLEIPIAEGIAEA